MFAYCGNNPIARADNGGKLWHVAFGAALGGLFAGAAKLVECIQSKDSLGETIGQVLVSTACGAIGGALAATGIGVVGQAVIGGVLGATESAINQVIDNGSIDRRMLLTDTASGVLGGVLGGKGASHGSKFMSYHRSQFIKNAALEGVDSALGKLSRHTWQWAKTNLRSATRWGVIKAFGGNKVTNYLINGVLNICDKLAGVD